MDPHDAWHEPEDGEKIELSEVPTSISIQEVLDARKVAKFSNEILSGIRRETGRFIETDDRFLRRIPPGGVDDLQIVVSETLRPPLLNLAHNSKIAGHPGQNRM